MPTNTNLTSNTSTSIPLERLLHFMQCSLDEGQLLEVDDPFFQAFTRADVEQQLKSMASTLDESHYQPAQWRIMKAFKRQFLRRNGAFKTQPKLQYMSSQIRNFYEGLGEQLVIQRERLNARMESSIANEAQAQRKEGIANEGITEATVAAPPYIGSLERLLVQRHRHCIVL